MANNHYFDHDADIGIIGQGKTLEEAFADAANAMFGIMADAETITPKQTLAVSFDEGDLELAFYTWLNLLLSESQINDLVLSKFEIERHGDHWQGKAWGEPWRDDIKQGVEVKGATLTELSVKQVAGKWEARCVVDV